MGYVNPARAGMIPRGTYLAPLMLCKPRASGDDPEGQEALEEWDT